MQATIDADLVDICPLHSSLESNALFMAREHQSKSIYLFGTSHSIMLVENCRAVNSIECCNVIITIQY